jgi:hypothetical protein
MMMQMASLTTSSEARFVMESRYRGGHRGELHELRLFPPPPMTKAYLTSNYIELLDKCQAGEAQLAGGTAVCVSPAKRGRGNR